MQTPKPAPVKSKAKVVDASKTPTRPTPAKSMTPADKAYSDIMKKYNYDPTKIPGWNGGKGTK
jgi:hypothetical protein